MPYFSGFAIYFIFWWITLFAVLPFGLSTQAEERSVVPGTVQSAPAQFRAMRVFLTTTLVSGGLFAIWLIVSNWFGLDVNKLMELMPSYQPS
ncbi:DUF1467 family protein [Rhizobium sp. CFBP 8762]|uniref:DUF1467 family protein n=1 Tax=Rhizobium sp. CFBP 8762 TaxID=2775279 RepID=UPI0017800CBE|nr:DUF1467 family protein [Rhizobium sp. CFBP 8762]MBD8552951.1 DUF1467 family protein [Rhizobium sp. CFBP 8762]